MRDTGVHWRLEGCASHENRAAADLSCYEFLRAALRTPWLSAFRLLLALTLSALVCCQRPPSAPSEGETGKPPAAASRDLSQDESAGGHVLRKHVGLSDDQLRQRLDEEREISGASTYTDRATAERVIAAAIAASRDRIQRWLQRPGRHSNLVLDYDAGSPIGRTLNRGDRLPRPCSHALIVLKYDAPGSYHVLTSYPECR
jgi:hypothetical protein